MSEDSALTPAHRWRAMLVVSLGVVVSVSTGVMVPVALPSIAEAMALSSDGAVAVVSVYQIVVLVSLLPLSTLGTGYGDRRIFCCGLAIFALGALFAALSPSLLWLMCSRGLQGFGAAAIASITPALVRSFYPTARLGQGMGVIAMAVALTAAVAPLLASVLLAAGDWPWLFLASLPVCLLAWWLALRWVPPSCRAPRSLDVGSTVLNIAGFALVMIGIDGLAQSETFGSAVVQLVVAAILLFWLVRRQLRQSAPMLPLDLMRIPQFALSIATAVLVFATQMLTFVVMPFLLRRVLDVAAVEAALYMSAWPLSAALFAPLAGRLADRYATGLLGAGGLALLAIGLGLLAGLSPADQVEDVLWRLVVCGAGFAFFQAPNNRAIMSAAPENRSNAASGMLAFARLFGQTLGAAVAGFMFGITAANALAIALWLGLGLACAAALVSGLRLKAPATVSPVESPDQR